MASHVEVRFFDENDSVNKGNDFTCILSIGSYLELTDLLDDISVLERNQSPQTAI